MHLSMRALSPARNVSVSASLLCSTKEKDVSLNRHDGSIAAANGLHGYAMCQPTPVMHNFAM